MIDLPASVAEAVGNRTADGTGKTAADLTRYRLIIEAVRPSLIVETGTWTGCSALWLARTSGAQVVTVDVDGDDRVPSVVRDAWSSYRVESLRGDSLDVAAEVAHVWSDETVDGTVLVSLDSDHSAAHVRAELDAYAPLVSPGSYLVCEDTIIRWLPHPLGGPDVWDGTSPLDAVEAWLPDHSEFAVDVAVENLMPTTQHPFGWLRKDWQCT